MAPTGAPGTLRTLRNCLINRGGEVEKSKAWVPYYTLPAGTFGLGVRAGGNLVVFGTNPALTMPSGDVEYLQVASGGKTPRRVLFAQTMFGVMFWILEWTDGTVSHFKDTTAITAYSGRGDAALARSAIAFGEKCYLPYNTGLYASKIQELSWNAGEDGEAFYDMSVHMGSAGRIVAMAEYLSSLAIFHERGVQTWHFEADPVAANPEKKLQRVGCVAPRTVVSFGGQDVFFLAASGVRSLRTRDLAASISASIFRIVSVSASVNSFMTKS